MKLPEFKHIVIKNKNSVHLWGATIDNSRQIQVLIGRKWMHVMLRRKYGYTRYIKFYKPPCTELLEETIANLWNRKLDDPFANWDYILEIISVHMELGDYVEK